MTDDDRETSCRICASGDSALCTFMHEFTSAVEDAYALWQLTYPEPPKLAAGGEGHRAGHAAFLKALHERKGGEPND